LRNLRSPSEEGAQEGGEGVNVFWKKTS